MATLPRTEPSRRTPHSRKSPARPSAIPSANNHTASNSSSRRDIPETRPTLSPAKPAPTHSPKSDNADADCSPPSTPRDFRKFARGAPNRSLRAAGIPPPTPQSLRRFPSASSEESSDHAAAKNKLPGKCPARSAPPASRPHRPRSWAHPATAPRNHYRRQMCAALLLDSSQPWPFRSMGRNQYPLTRQRIEPSMRRFLQQRSIIHAFHKRAIVRSQPSGGHLCQVFGRGFLQL